MSHRVLKTAGLALLAICSASTAHATANARGTLIVHAQPEIAYCSDTPSYCGDASLSYCDLAQTRVDGPANTVFFVFASFPAGSSPSLAGVTFGVQYSNSLSLLGHGSCGDFELADSSWPASNTGTAVTWNTPQQTRLVPIYWFAGYNYDSPSPALFATTPHPTQGGNFADHHTPARVDIIRNYGALGFDQDGINGCDPILPAGTGACCFPDHNCVTNVDGDECVAQGGLYAGDFSDCSACGYDIPGACCVPDAGCQLISQYECEVQHGVFFEYQANCPTGLCSTLGACCLSNGDCEIFYEDQCAQIPQAVWHGDVPCDPNPCNPEGGACCFPWGDCGFTTQSVCDANQGYFLGVGTDCVPDPCAVYPGACCLPSGECVIQLPQDCENLGGAYVGANTDCSPNPCEQPEGACCLANGDCVITTESDCSGSWSGPDTVCDQVPCLPVSVEPSTWGRIKSRFR